MKTLSPREKHEWLLSLKPGDEVVICERGRYPVIERVSRTAPGRVVVGGHLQKFSTESGIEIKSESRSYWCRFIEPVSEQLREQADLGLFWRWIRQLKQHFSPENIGEPEFPVEVARQILVAFEQLPKAKD